MFVQSKQSQLTQRTKPTIKKKSCYNGVVCAVQTLKDIGLDMGNKQVYIINWVVIVSMCRFSLDYQWSAFHASINAYRYVN